MSEKGLTESWCILFHKFQTTGEENVRNKSLTERSDEDDDEDDDDGVPFDDIDGVPLGAGANSRGQVISQTL